MNIELEEQRSKIYFDFGLVPLLWIQIIRSSAFILSITVFEEWAKKTFNLSNGLLQCLLLVCFVSVTAYQLNMNEKCWYYCDVIELLLSSAGKSNLMQRGIFLFRSACRQLEMSSCQKVKSFIFLSFRNLFRSTQLVKDFFFYWEKEVLNALSNRKTELLSFFTHSKVFF